MVQWTLRCGTAGAAWVSVGVGIATSGLVWYAWGYVDPTPVMHDEASYVFQARTFALGRLSNPSPVVPEFFEQFHVLVTPTYASKYPFGTAVLLVPGVWLGTPAIIPVALAGVRAALLFVLASRVANPLVGILAWLCWLTSPRAVDWASSYLSQNVSSVLWLLGWVLLLNWRDRGRHRSLIGVGACVGWMAVTRPLTAVAFGVPVAIAAMLSRRLGWRGCVAGAVPAVLILCLLPVSNHAVLGRWLEMPWSAWARAYAPSDRLGFGASPSPPERALTTEMVAFNRYFADMYLNHVATRVPGIAAERLSSMVSDMFPGFRWVLVVFVGVAMVGARAEAIVALLSVGALLVAYTAYAHPPWGLYYVEGHATLAFLAASGLWRALVWLSTLGPPAPAGSRVGTLVVHPINSIAAALVAVVAIGGVWQATLVAKSVRETKRDRMAAQRSFRERGNALCGGRCVVFVRYASFHNPHKSLIVNEPDLLGSRMWIVHDLGAEKNQQLVRTAADRLMLVYDEATAQFSQYGVSR